MSLEKLPSAAEQEFKQRSLELLAVQLEELPLTPGYPSKEERLYLSRLAFTTNGQPFLPTGTWETNSPRVENAEQTKLKEQGLQLDHQGRPLHPWLYDLLPQGLVTGKGRYYHWGPNRTVDPVVIQNDHLLLIQRGDTGAWALPGGFLDGDESVVEAGKRELGEETGLVTDHEPKITYSGPVADIRTTANAWPETTALLFELEGWILPEVRGMDDAQAAAWVALGGLEKLQLYGSHQLLIEQALAQRDL
jgi:ADP-ribose pyrophosphatase YjhB (NUDIX family)